MFIVHLHRAGASLRLGPFIGLTLYPAVVLTLDDPAHPCPVARLTRAAGRWAWEAGGGRYDGYTVEYAPAAAAPAGG